MSEENPLKESGRLTGKQVFIKAMICLLLSFAYYVFMFENVLRFYYDDTLGTAPVWGDYVYWGYPFFVVVVIAFLLRNINLHRIKLFLLSVPVAGFYLFLSFFFWLILSLKGETSNCLKKAVIGNRSLYDWLFQIDYTNLGTQMNTTDWGEYIFTFMSLIDKLFMHVASLCILFNSEEIC
ncbi:MAG: hypothetical protein LIP01_10805 [Tannerellaceae bacterium]|nr:hypothetical protein [Tannerellaceae bacterium]